MAPCTQGMCTCASARVTCNVCAFGRVLLASDTRQRLAFTTPAPAGRCCARERRHARQPAVGARTALALCAAPEQAHAPEGARHMTHKAKRASNDPHTVAEGDGGLSAPAA